MVTARDGDGGSGGGDKVGKFDNSGDNSGNHVDLRKSENCIPNLHTCANVGDKAENKGGCDNIAMETNQIEGVVGDDSVVDYVDPKRKRREITKSQMASETNLELGFSQVDGPSSKNDLLAGAAVQARFSQ